MVGKDTPTSRLGVHIMRSVINGLSLSLFLAFAFFWGCIGPQPIKIGFTGQFTGKFSDLGVQGRNGAQLALEHINASGGIHGRPLLMFAVDDGNTPEGARSALDRLHDEGVFLVIGNMTSSQTLAALPHAEELGMIMISPTTSSPLLEDRVDAHYRVISSSDTWSTALGRYAAEAGNATVAGIYDRDNEAYAKTFLDSFLASFAAAGGRSLGEVSFRSSEVPDWSAYMELIDKTRPDALVVSASARDTAHLADALRRRGITLPIFSSPWAFTKDLIRFAGPAAEGIVSALSFSPDSTSPEFASFKRQYEERFGRKPGFAAAFSYEAMLTAAVALRKTNGSALGLTEVLGSLGPIQGVNGVFDLDAEGDTTRPSYILIIEGGAITTIRQYEAP